MARPRRVALAFPTGAPYFERVLRGILDHAATHGPWRFDLNPRIGPVRVRDLRGWRGDGIIGWLSDPVEERRAARLGVPVVNLSSGPLAPVLPSVIPDHRAIGNLAAAHLIDRGFRRFGYYGLGDVTSGRERGAGFAATVEAMGYPCARYLVSRRREALDAWRPDRDALVKWLRRLRPPVGLFAVHDYRARMVLEACASLALDVPGQVAVVGANDDVVACELAVPSLTSVELPGLEVGRRAAALLEQLMDGKPALGGPLLVPPRRVVARDSTDVVAVADAALAQAARHVADHLDRSLVIGEIAAAAGISRRLLEQRFREQLGTSPHRYICRLRVDRAKQLLAASNGRATLREIARRCGFADVRRLNLVFARVEGQPLSAWRQRHGGPGAA